ncbi:MAG: glycosyl hydrolase 53 family protein [Pseudomonadota bacterium]
MHKGSWVALLCIAAGLGCAPQVTTDRKADHWRAPWRGVDLSYVNELEHCGAHYSDSNGRTDPFEIFAAAGANWVRLRLWHSPDWTDYSTLEDVQRSIRRARRAGMKVLLDFHYSDDWVHPGKQLVPRAWTTHVGDTDSLAQLLGQYTYDTLTQLADAKLLPDAVQVGNETNTDLLITKEVAEDAPINWSRNVQLLNAGIDAVRRVSLETASDIAVMLHIAQPENVSAWFRAGASAGLHNYDLIGISYYPKWSSTSFDQIGGMIAEWRAEFAADVVIVETAYPWTTKGQDAATNLLGTDSLVDGFPATIDGQREQLLALQEQVAGSGGLGVVYWEPAWVSTGCSTRWGKGSHWENATLFDFDGRLHRGADFLKP